MFKDIPGYEGIYEISKKGMVRRIKTGRILKHCLNSNGYPTIHLYKQGKRIDYKVHRLVLIIWDRFPKPGEETRHLDSNKLNCNLGNLRWGTRTENMSDRFDVDGYRQKSCGNSLGEIFTSLSKAARYYNVTRSAIMRACQGKYKSCGLTWEYIDG